MKITAVQCRWRLWRPPVLAFALLFSVPAALGFCPQPDPTVACEFLNSDAVFVGTVISVRAVPAHGQELDGWLYELTVEELFRGPRRNALDVFTENSSGRFPLEVARRYLLFADEVGGRFEITNCGNSALASRSPGIVRELRKLRTPKDALVEGRVSFSGIPDTGSHAASVRVVIRGSQGIFETVSDREGRFRLHVPPGQYTAEVQQIPHWKITPYDLSYEKPRHFDARGGRCSGLQFVANPI